jgi:hypothetical protein
LAEDTKWELAIVETVYSFYRKLLQESAREPVPLPGDLHLISLGELDTSFPDPLSRLRGWLKLLDMAVAPSMLRQSLTPETDRCCATTRGRRQRRTLIATRPISFQHFCTAIREFPANGTNMDIRWTAWSRFLLSKLR